jgi:acyl-CoA thioester hydrolase
MFSINTKIRVVYADTDQMGVVYYGNYARYYEIARTEALRQIGTSYKDIETYGCVMPVISLESRYLKPACYDDMLTVKTIIKELPTSQMKFEYEIFNEQGELLNTGNTILVFVNRETNKPMKVPEWLTEILSRHI